MKPNKIMAMVDQIIANVKSELGSKLVALGLPASKTGAACVLAKDVIMEKLTTQASGANMSGLMNLFNSKQPLDQSLLVQNMMSDYSTKMVGKLGATESVAKSVSTFMIPFIMSKLSNNVASGGQETLKTLINGTGTFEKLKSMGGNFLKVMVF